MAKSSMETLKLGFVLAVFAAVSCAVLALVNNVTAPVIAQNKIEKAKAAMTVVMPEADDFAPLDSFEPSKNASIKILSVYEAKKAGSTIGAVAQVTGPTYDKGTIMVGMSSDGVVTGLQFLELSDSPGFGLKANDPTFTLPSGKTFYGQFEGKDAKAGFVPGETFDTISGATITSVAVAELVKEGTSSMLKFFGGAK